MANGAKKSAVSESILKMSFHRGDILFVDASIPLECFSSVNLPVDFQVPVIPVHTIMIKHADGMMERQSVSDCVHKMSKEELEKLLHA